MIRFTSHFCNDEDLGSLDQGYMGFECHAEGMRGGLGVRAYGPRAGRGIEATIAYAPPRDSSVPWVVAAARATGDALAALGGEYTIAADGRHIWRVSGRRGRAVMDAIRDAIVSAFDGLGVVATSTHNGRRLKVGMTDMQATAPRWWQHPGNVWPDDAVRPD